MPSTGPASFAQERLFFIDQLDPGSPGYVVVCALRLTGVVDRDALAGALSDLAARHEPLRTTFAVRDGALTQIVREEPQVELHVTRRPRVDRRAQDDQVRAHVAQEVRRPFDLTAGPVVRYALLTWSEREHALVVLAHHIACDGWSVGVLLRDLAIAYRARVMGSDMPTAAASYLEYARAQRDRWDGGNADGLDHWTEALAGAPHLDLPTDHVRPAVLGSAGAVVRADLDPELLQRLRRHAREHGVSLFMLLLAAYARLLTWYSRQPEAVIGVPVANRLDEDEDDLVGCFVNVLPLRVRVADQPDFAHLLRHVREVALSGFGSQDVPFERIVRALGPERERSRSPVFQASFTLQNYTVELPDLLGLEVAEIDVEVEAAKFELALTVDLSGARPFSRLEYHTDLFTAPTAEGLLGHFQHLLATIAPAAGGQAQAPTMVSAAEADRLVALGSPDTAPDGPTGPLLARFEEHARTAPEAVAVRHGGASVGYGELDRRAERLAARLRRLGVRAGDLVGLCLDRSPDIVAAILATWKAGAAYLPLDPGYPPQRLRLILDSSAVTLVLVQPRTVTAVRTAAAQGGIRLVDVTAPERSGPPGDPATAPVTAPAGGDPELAYVIYTSGSTGVPKGVMVGRTGVDLLFSATPGGLRVGPDDVWLCAHSFAFDFSVWEVWGALAYGGTVVIADAADVVDPARLAALVRSERVTVLSQTPGSLHRLLPELTRGTPALAALRYVVCGGEALSWSRLADLLAGVDAGTRIVNMYGITEGTVHVTAREATVAELPAVRDGDVGRPLPSGRCYVLDPQGRPAGTDVPGELYIGGPLVALGYLRSPELTAERFRPDPYRAGGTIYRTGDICRWTSGGQLLYLGREDGQVQLRGHRVEVAEVERVLLRDPSVRAAAVLTADDRLVAFVVPTGSPTGSPTGGSAGGSAGGGPDLPALTRQVREALPAYMVPSRTVVVAEIPLTAHGKVDAAALLSRARTAAPPAGAAAPATPLQRQLLELWAGVLGRSDVGPRDNFFDVGGHSFALMTLQSRMAERGLSISVTDLFRLGTIEACAAHLGPQPVRPPTPAAAGGDRGHRRRSGMRRLADRTARVAGTRESGSDPTARRPQPTRES